jgi:ethanolamine utilization protein EutQ (cupin superfamily)
MPIHHITPQNGSIRKVSESYAILNLLTAQESENVSVAIGTATNHNETTSTSSERVYFILEGEMTINDEILAKQGEVIYIPKHTEYSFKGTFKTLIINVPAFKLKNENIK